MHKSAGVFSSLNSFTEFGNTEVSHIDLGDSRRRHDISDIHKLIDWFEKNDPFQVSDHRLHSLFSGITAGEEDDINCDDAEAVGDCLMEKMNNMMFSEVVMCKTDRVKTLASVTSTLSLGDKHVPVYSVVLFSRLLDIVSYQKNNNLLCYEFCPGSAYIWPTKTCANGHISA